jgi:hypothetical protein
MATLIPSLSSCTRRMTSGEQPAHGLVLAAHDLLDVAGDALEEGLGVAGGKLGE